jgi:hypothetical protein
MTSYTINYEGLDARQLEEKAVQDIRDYLGEEMWAKVLAHMTGCGYVPALQEFRTACWLLGITGAPVRPFYNYCYPENRLPPSLQIVGAA